MGSKIAIASALVVASVLSASADAQPEPGQISNFEAAHVTPLALNSDESELIAVNTPNGSIEVFNLASGVPQFDRAVKVGVDPVSVRLRNDREAWVVNTTSDSVSVVDLEASTVVRTLTVCDEPGDVIFAGTPERAYISCAGDEAVVVYNAEDPSAELERIAILGEQPRALAKSTDGRSIYLAIFESGNGTTALSAKTNCCETNLVLDESSPYGGENPFPNFGEVYNPPLNPDNPAPSNLTSVIVRRASEGQWLDDNGKDWGHLVTGGAGRRDRIAGWDLIDRDIAIIDVTSHNVTYRGGAVNIAMALGVNPVTNDVMVVGTDAENQIRFEPVLNARFLKVRSARYLPDGSLQVRDINPHLDYAETTLPQSIRDLSIGDPRGVSWQSNGQRAVVTGMGSNNLIQIDRAGNRVGSPIEVGEGPTGVVVSSQPDTAYVLNKFDASISVIRLDIGAETHRTPFSVDPTPTVVRDGRPMLYDTHRFSGTGHVSCASCHVDGKTDRLAWDLGNPAGEMTTTGGVEHHPMKGPLLTQTLVDTVQSPFLHWRGDKEDLGHFAEAFHTLQGADEPATEEEMHAMEAFLRTLRTPPNPYRNLDNSYPTALELRGPGGDIIRTGNAVLGAQRFESSCRRCHDGHTGRGSRFVNGSFSGGQFLNPPRWQNFYKRDGLWFRDATASTAGFGFQQDGTFDSLHNQTRSDDMMAFMYSFNGSFPYTPAGLSAATIAVDAHAAVGRQVTLSIIEPQSDLLDQLVDLGQRRVVDLTAHSCVANRRVGYVMNGDATFAPDTGGATVTLAALKDSALTSPVTFTVVRAGTSETFALDEDADGRLDGAENHAGRACTPPRLNVIENGDFADVRVPNPGWRNLAQLEGWQNVNGGVEVWNGLSGIEGPNGEATLMELDARAGTSSDEIFQSVDVPAGLTLDLEFAFAGRPGSGVLDNAFDVLWNNEVVGSFAPNGANQSPSEPAWDVATLRVTSVGSNRLAFRESGTNNGRGALITGVAAYPTTTRNLIENGLFAHGSVPQSGWRTVTNLAGWESAAGHFEVWHGLFGISGPNGEATLIELDAGRRVRDAVSQSITAAAGTPVTIKFSYSGRPNVAPGSNAFEVRWNNEVVGSFSPDGRGVARSTPEWESVDISVTSAGENQLMFRETGANDSVGALITGVEVIGSP